MNSIGTNSHKTATAIETLWGKGSPEERWQRKIEIIILLIARLGWASVELVNYYLQQVKRDWPKCSVDQGWLISKKGIIDDKVATILVLTHKAQSTARKLDNRLGKRIDKEISRQSRHDLVAAWSAIWFINNCYQFKFGRDQLEIWADRILRGFIHDEQNRPDISINYGETTLLNVEVERTRKTNDEEHYFFLKKLQNYRNNDIDTIIVFERISQAEKFIDQLKLAENFGINSWRRNSHTNKNYEVKNDDREIILLSLMIGIWNHQNKNFDQFIFHNLEQFDSPLDNFEINKQFLN
jgi:hypothetical protein